jgi:predicted P-loop ATPase
MITDRIAKPKKEKKTDSLELISEYLTSEGIKRNEITSFFEKNGTTLSEQKLNHHFIKLKSKHPQSKGITKQNWDLTLNSTIIETINPIKDFFRDNKNINEKGLIDKLIDSIEIIPNLELEKKFPEGYNNTKRVVKILFTKWFVGMIASVYKDYYNCLMIVLIGPKGCGKTEFFRRLLPTELKVYFAQSKFNDGKDSEALMCEKLIILNDELDGLNQKEARSFRNFISSNYYTFRPPYAKQNITIKRLASVCGASNDRNIINDAENNRRIIPIEILSMNHDKFNDIDKRLLTMEAFHLFEAGYKWELTSEEMIFLDILSENYEFTSIEYELINQFYSPLNATIELTCSEIKSKIEEQTKQRLNINKIGSNLRRLGFKSKRIKRNGRTAQVYEVNPILYTN